MRTTFSILLVSFAIVCMSMTQCERCIREDMVIKADDKNWMPYAGKDSVAFITAAGIVTKFRCSYGDTTRTGLNFNCDDEYRYDSVGFSLEISPADSLMLWGRLSYSSQLCLHAFNRQMGFISTCNVIDESPSILKKVYATLQLDGFTYGTSRLVIAYPNSNPGFDSVFIAKNYGIVGFKYNNNFYYLKH